MKISIWLTIALLASSSVSSTYGEEDTSAVRANKLFSEFERRQFVPLSADGRPVEVSGWMMEASNGAPLHRALLKKQAEQLANLGVDVFPVAMRFLDHDEMYIRYIAAESLRMLTGENPLWYSFGTPGQAFNGDPDWSGEAKAKWNAWYRLVQKKKAEQGVAPQSATRSESDSEGGDKPQPPSHRRGTQFSLP